MTITRLERRNGRQQNEARTVALVVRVSTDRQASNPEGSLTTQLQRLRAHVDYKNGSGEEWIEAGVYELKGVSGKDSMRSQEYAELFAAVRAGRINTIVCTALERLCRSVKDFLWFFEFINEHGVEFVCLKQQYDTTTPQGKLFVTIMMALAEFEREQTADRTRDAMHARSERGLWNGGQLLGYDLDPDRKGYLIPNEEESALVNFAFDTYVSRGSLRETVTTLNAGGYRTKAYNSRRGQIHRGKEFSLTSVLYLLKNPAYIGRKEINKSTQSTGRDCRLVDAVWPGIVEASRFEEAQRLLATNGRTRHNAAASVRHTYLLSEGVLQCGRCETRMEGRSGTGRLAVKYFYYVCRNKDCGLRVTAGEIENAVVARIAELSGDPALLNSLVSATNARLQGQAPALAKRKKALQRGLGTVKSEAEKILGEWPSLDGSEAKAFLTDKLNELGKRKTEIQTALAEAEDGLLRLDERAVSAEQVRSALLRFSEVFACLKPHEQKELVRLVVHRAELHDRKIVLEINGSAPANMAEAQSQSVSRFGSSNWLPGKDSNLRHAD